MGVAILNYQERVKENVWASVLGQQNETQMVRAWTQYRIFLVREVEPQPPQKGTVMIRRGWVL